ncbi:MAG TPA: adenylate/guanylate cyclase domain-containing protein [Candidatus Baltobacteraceae bacterium]|nr:adenylate/guanylate cyclase domain-containing protein [Candidatus Baltobacteraceae bacterium]
MFPSGTVALLFTDIEGSSHRWETYPEAMSAAVKRHDAILSEVIDSHGGYTFKRLGDAFCAAFSTVPQAVAAAHDAQRALLTEDFSAVNGLKVRIAVHAGHTEERDGDYFGPAVNRVARLLAIGSGSQVLVSSTAANLMQSEMPEHASMLDLGTHRLKDLAHPERVYQYVAPGLPTEFPALHSLDARPNNNLPLQLTSFVGRSEEIAQIKALLETHRLVTLVGAGGVGKTRLSLQAGADLLNHYDDGVWVVELAPLSDGTLIAAELARVFEVRASAERLTDALIASLRGRRALLIIDNCEHLIEPAAQIIDKILRGSPTLRILATSREPLKVSGEQAHRVASLEQSAAVALFKDRATAANDTFTLTGANVASVEKICERLDGIALAIELAAARVRTMDVGLLLRLLEERFRILTDGDRTALPRHQTMRALIDWSHDLLSPQEQTLFRRLSVFSGGWSLDAAGAVCADETLESWNVYDVLGALVEKSLVVAELAASSARYHFLESTRHYSAEKLAAAGERDRLRAAHASYYTQFAQQLEQRWTITPTRIWEQEVESELDNLRGAIEYSLTEGHDVELGSQLVTALPLYWNAHRAEGQRYASAALEVKRDLTPATLAKVWLTGAIVNLASNFRLSREYAEYAKAGFEALGDAFGAMRALRWIGVASTLLRDLHRGRVSFTQALNYFESHGEERWANWTLESLAVHANFSGDVALARDRYERAMAKARLQDDDFTISACVLSLAECEYEAGNVKRAIELAREGIAHDRMLRWPRTLPNTLANLAAYLVATGEVEPAREAANEALRLAADAGEVQLVAFAVQHLAAVAGMRGEFERCARLLGYTNTVFTASLPREFTEQTEYDAVLAKLRAVLGESRANDLVKRGESLTQDRAVAEALSI